MGVLALAVFASRFYHKVGPEEAIVRAGAGGLRAVTGVGIVVIPLIHRAEKMDLSVKRIEIKRRGEQGLIFKDNKRADIDVTLLARVNKTREDILRAAQALGCRRASDSAALAEVFGARFSEASKTVGKHFDFVELYQDQDRFKEEILKAIGTDLHGYVLDDCAIDYLEQTPVEMMNLQGVLDAEGIKNGHSSQDIGGRFDEANMQRLHEAVAALKATRESLGLSLADVRARMGIEEDNLSPLENEASANPTIDTLTQYANAVGKEIVIALVDKQD